MDRKKEIAKQMATLAAELQEMKAKEVRELADKAKSYGNDWLVQIAEGMLHKQFGEKPKTPKLGYVLANVYHVLVSELDYPSNHKKKIPQDIMDLLTKISKHFDISDYVFAHTHYDESSNGFFFRRS